MYMNKHLKGKFCRLVFYDGVPSEENVRTLKGIFIEQNDNFLTIQTLKGKYVYNNSLVLKIMPLKEQPKEDV